MQVKLGLIGENISYTLSPKVHNAIFDYIGVNGSFTVFDTPREKFDATFKKMCETLDGFNVTKPYKTDAAAAVNEDRSGVGAVNTVVTGKKLFGYNTDGDGFMRSFEENRPHLRSKSVLVLGAGGAARVVVQRLKNAGYSVYVHNRSRERLETLVALENVAPYSGETVHTVVNCTTCGYKDGEDPAALMDLNAVEYAFDLIYNPPKTAFLRRFEERGAAVANGFDMLVYQAVKAEEIILPSVNFADGDYTAIKRLVKSRIS